MPEPDRDETAQQHAPRINPGGVAAETLRRGEELYRRLMQQLPNVAVFVFDHDLRLLVAEGEALTHQGLRDTDVEGKLLSDVLVEDAFSDLEPHYRAALAGERKECERLSVDGGRYFRVTTSALRDDDGQVWAGLTMAQDITDLRASERYLRSHSEELERLSQRDDLTGLANRVRFGDRLEHALGRAVRAGNDVAAVFLDLDGFKQINDTLGHEAGDELLRTVAQRLAGAVREIDTVARLGGDEFAVLLESMSEHEEVVFAVERLFTSLRHPIALAAQEVFPRASAGIALGPRDAGTRQGLLTAADLAMYRVKAGGGNGYRFFDLEMHERALDRVAIEAELHRALERDELLLHYQPAVDLNTGRVVSVEALVRWQHPERGLMPPADFIPIAEHSGLSEQVTAWVLERASRQLRAWGDAGLAGFRIAVNASTRDVRGGLSVLVGKVLAGVGLPADALEIEITERLLGETDQVQDRMFRQLKELGVHVTLDDFGTGWSSLARLHAFPVDALKIDRSFTRAPDDVSAIARSIIGLAHNLDLCVVAEGVETATQLDRLRDAGCNQASGFHICRPRPAEEVTAWLAAR
jgi:diguanylate cyclase (GGDEF)-like protein/PAS domain S-box-containing protein